jgi:hypothetical protein
MKEFGIIIPNTSCACSSADNFWFCIGTGVGACPRSFIGSRLFRHLDFRTGTHPDDARGLDLGLVPTKTKTLLIWRKIKI